MAERLTGARDPGGPGPTRPHSIREDHVEAFFADPDRYLAGNPAVEVRAQLVRGVLGSCRGLSVLDAGCGDGRLSLQFLPLARSVTLLDRSPGMLERTQANTPADCGSRVERMLGDLAVLDLKARYDVVLCIGVLAHVASWEDIVARVARAVGPGGRAVLQTTDADRALARFQRLWGRTRSRFPGAPGYTLNRLSMEAVRRAAADRGLELVLTRRYGLEFPGVGSLPAPAQRWLAEAASRRSRLSRHGVEVLMLFRRVDQACGGQIPVDRWGKADSSAA